MPVTDVASLNVSTNRVCFNITTTTDEILEGREEFTVQFSITDQNGAFFPATDGNKTVIFITDDDSELCVKVKHPTMHIYYVPLYTKLIDVSIAFNKTVYSFAENDNSLYLEIVKFGTTSLTVAVDVEIANIADGKSELYCIACLQNYLSNKYSN